MKSRYVGNGVGKKSFIVLATISMILGIFALSRIARGLSMSCGSTDNDALKAACAEFDGTEDTGAFWLAPSGNLESNSIETSQTSGSITVSLVGVYINAAGAGNADGSDMYATRIRMQDYYGGSLSDIVQISDSAVLSRGYVSGNTQGAVSSGGSISATLNIDRFKEKATFVSAPGGNDYYTLTVKFYRCPSNSSGSITGTCGSWGTSLIKLYITGGGTSTPTSTPTVTTSTITEYRYRDASRRATYNGEANVNYNGTGNGGTYTIYRGRGEEETLATVNPAFTHFLEKTSGPNVSELSTNWRVYASGSDGAGSGGSGSWIGNGRSQVFSESPSVTAEMGNRIEVCQTLEYDSSVTQSARQMQSRTVTITYEDGVEKSRSPSDDNTGWSSPTPSLDSTWSTGGWSSKQTSPSSYGINSPTSGGKAQKKACIYFYQPYYYKEGKNTFSGEVTGRTENNPLKNCGEITAGSEKREDRECFMKSTYDDSDPKTNTTVKFRDKIIMNSSEELEYGLSNGTWPLSGEYDTNGGWFNKGKGDTGTEWEILGLSADRGTTDGNSGDPQTVKDFDQQQKEGVDLGIFDDFNYYNQLRYDKCVEYVKRSDGKYYIKSRSGKNGWSMVYFMLYHPYNYKTSASAEITSSNLYVGTIGQAEVRAEYLARKNEPVTGNDADYQTSLPEAARKYYAVFTVEDKNMGADEAIGGLKSDSYDESTGGVKRTYNKEDNSGNFDNLCEAIGDMGLEDSTKLVKGMSNCVSREFTEDVNDKVKFNVPDEYGVKVCVVAGVNFADSHGKPAAENVSLGDNEGFDAVPYFNVDVNNKHPRKSGEGGIYMNSNYWRISSAACETVKAEPKFQTWNAGFYTDGIVNMSTEIKVPGQKFSLGGTPVSTP